MTTRSTVIPATSFIAVVSATAVARGFIHRLPVMQITVMESPLTATDAAVSVCAVNAYNLFDLCECISYKIKAYLSLLTFYIFVWLCFFVPGFLLLLMVPVIGLRIISIPESISRLVMLAVCVEVFGLGLTFLASTALLDFAGIMLGILALLIK